MHLPWEQFMAFWEKAMSFISVRIFALAILGRQLHLYGDITSSIIKVMNHVDAAFFIISKVIKLASYYLCIKVGNHILIMTMLHVVLFYMQPKIFPYIDERKL